MADSPQEEMIPEKATAKEDAIPYCDIKALAERYKVPKDLSKRQTKKLVKRYRKEEFKTEWKKQKRMREKERKKQMKEGQAHHHFTPPAKKVKKMSDAGASNHKIVIDVGFEDLMTDYDIVMLAKQLQRCYSLNRRTEMPVQLHLTSFGGRTKTRMEEALSGFNKWDVHVHPESYLEQFGSDSVVFLTSESPNVLQTLDPDKAYIIGGLVDHNHHKGYCHRMAMEQGVAHARLPLQEFVRLNTRSVLAIPHVFETLLAFINNGGDWKAAISSAIPLRKIDSSPGPNVAVFQPHQEEKMAVVEDKGAVKEGEEAVDAGGSTEKKKKKKRKRTYKRFLFHPYPLGSSSSEEDSEEEEAEKKPKGKEEEEKDDEEEEGLMPF